MPVRQPVSRRVHATWRADAGRRPSIRAVVEALRATGARLSVRGRAGGGASGRASERARASEAGRARASEAGRAPGRPPGPVTP
ncbi:hypothetical protein BU197_00920 [Streptomyces sp. CBMA291]|nr:hypothetical protein [Streptomyces sp. CBMA291]MBD0714286.1 hypothetical protein [Streptomyces sp. CBMA370]